MSNGAANGASAAQMNEIMQAGLNKAADLLDKENFEEAAKAAGQAKPFHQKQTVAAMKKLC